jgi:hypothetical protein
MDITLMSSEEKESSDDEPFKIKPLPWRLEEFNCLLEDLDSKYLNLQTNRSKRQMIKAGERGFPFV